MNYKIIEEKINIEIKKNKEFDIFLKKINKNNNLNFKNLLILPIQRVKKIFFILIK
jgi:hypothetical protein